MLKGKLENLDPQFRLWGQNELITELLEHYEKLDEDLKAEIPLKRIWTMAAQEGEG